MTPVGFECVNCHHRLSVSADGTGRAVRCPKCQVVMKIPAPGGTPPASSHRRSPLDDYGASADTDSIFSDPYDSDAESVFGRPSEVRRPILPPGPPDHSQSTVRVPGVADPPSVVIPTPVAALPAEPPDPFGAMVEEVMGRSRYDADEDTDPDEDADPPGPGGWMKWALVGVSVYAVLATAAAVWGWARPVAEPPPAHTLKR